MDELRSIAKELAKITSRIDLYYVIFKTDDYGQCWENLYELMNFFSGRYEIPNELLERLMAAKK